MILKKNMVFKPYSFLIILLGVIMKKKIKKFIKLSNGQFLKIVFTYGKRDNIWGMDIVVANTKRKCNDCLCKTEYSPKIIYGKTTGNKLGLEALSIAKNELLDFEKHLTYKTNIKIIGASKRLKNVYRYLKRYGYIEKVVNNNGHDRIVMYKEINWKEA